jgi:threonine-phosphate decarboxylase
MSIVPRVEVGQLTPAVHGSVDRGELETLGLDPTHVLDFSANTNPFGPSPAVRAAIGQVRFEGYPDRSALGLRAALAEALDVPPDCVLPGNGASELIWLIALAYLQRGETALIATPTYSEYGRASALMGARAFTLEARACTGFHFPEIAFLAELDRLRPRVVFLANPNNPTGTVVDSAWLHACARRHPSTMFVVDEAYLPFAPGMASAVLDRPDNVLVLRSMTKDHGLAGLRLGYAVGSAAVVESLARVQPPWSVNAFAQAAGVAALQDSGHVDQSLRRLREANAALVAGLLELGWCPLSSAVHFFLLPVGDGAAFRASLLRRNILVRDCASFGLPQYVRIATRRPEENERLLHAVRALHLPPPPSPRVATRGSGPREVAHGR